MGDLDVMEEIAAVVPELSGEVLDRCFMRPADFGSVPMDSKEVREQRDTDFQKEMKDLDAMWETRLSTIGEVPMLYLSKSL